MTNNLDGAAAQSVALSAEAAQVAGVDVLWMVIATSLVMFMQGGFLLLEAGSVRSKNTINVAQKNATDLVVSGCIFMTLGATIMFGVGSTGWFGFGGFSFSDAVHQPMLIYQFGFCAAAATIVSGAIAERMRFIAYIFLTVIIAAAVYPIFGHLVWGNALIANNPAFLADAGFLDFAGGSVVHVVGGSAALAACLAVGPRIGRFDEEGKVVTMPGHSSVLSLFGMVLLAIAWVGFNAGTASPATPAFTQIVANTVVGMCFGGAAGLVFDLARGHQSTHPKTICTGVLGGLVGVTSACAFVDFHGAMAIGFISGLAATGASKLLLHRFKVDDPVDAIATHLIAGVVGTLLIPFFILPEMLTMSRFSLLGVQTMGIGIAFAWAFGATFVALKLFSLFSNIRVTEDEEYIGLNLVEHNENIDLEPLKELVKEATSQANVEAQPAAASLGLEGDPFAEQQTPLVGLMMGKTLEARQEVQQGQERFLDYERVDSDWLWESDPQFCLTYVSARFEEGFGATANELIGRSYLEMLEPVETSIEDLANKIKAKADFQDQVFACKDASGQLRVFSIAGIARFDARGDFTGYRGRSLDITDQLKAQDEIEFLAFHDHLTGLANRKSFENKVLELQRKVAETGDMIAIVSLDLDGFKPVNDSFGHSVGDELLRIVAKRLQSTSNKETIISRFGGDEFVIATPVAQGRMGTLGNFTARIVDAIRRSYKIEGLEININASLGSAIYPQDGVDIEEIIQLSDIALYEAKAKSKGKWMEFSAEMKANLVRRKMLEDDLCKAIDKGGIYAVYQPQIDLKTQKLTGFEALARWFHPEFGELAPDEFIRIAEEIGVVGQLGQIILREACKTAAKWPKLNGLELNISVNVAPQQFYNQDILGVVKQAIKETGLDPKRLEIEITEGTLVRESDEAIKILESLRELGVKVAVDDFGTGYSSLSYLQRFPLDRLKIDRAFVQELENNAGDQRITHAIVELGRNLGLNVIAEGVETQGQMDVLSDMSCHEAQGFLISRPVGAVQTLGIIAQSALSPGKPWDVSQEPLPDAGAEDDNPKYNDGNAGSANRSVG